MSRRSPSATGADLARIDRVARLLDSRFRVPLTPVRFGLDSILGLVPGIGDVLTAAPSAWMIWEGYRLGAPKRTLLQMGANTGIDFVLGSVPLIGDIFDVGFKANLRNAALLRSSVAPVAVPA